MSKLKQLTGQGTPQKAMDPMKEREPVETPGAAQALPAGDPAPQKEGYSFVMFSACMVFQPLPVMHQLTMRQLQRPLTWQRQRQTRWKDLEEDLQAAAAIPLL